MDGVAVHWYWDIVDPRIGLDVTHDHFPNKFLISTEASNGKFDRTTERLQRKTASVSSS